MIAWIPCFKSCPREGASGIGSRNLARYNTDLAAIRAAIKELEDDIAALEALLNGQRPRKAVGVVPRDW